MAKVRNKGTTTKKLSGFPIGIFVEPDGKRPGFAQRRLDALIEKKKTTRLTSDESRDLDEALDYIDSKSIQILEFQLATMKPRSKSPPRSTHRRGNRRSR